MAPDRVTVPLCPAPLITNDLVADPSAMTPSYVKLAPAEAARPPFEELRVILRLELRVRLLLASKVPPANPIVPAVEPSAPSLEITKVPAYMVVSPPNVLAPVNLTVPA